MSRRTVIVVTLIVLLAGACLCLFFLSTRERGRVSQAPAWEALGPHLAEMREVIPNTRDPDIVEVTGSSVVKSWDGGRTWRFLRRLSGEDKYADNRKLEPPPNLSGLRTSCANPQFPSIFYAGTDIGGKSHGDFYQSGDGGKTWTKVPLMTEAKAFKKGLRVYEIVATRGNPSSVFVGTSDGLFIGRDDGKDIRFEAETKLSHRRVYDLAVLLHVRRIYAATDNGVYVSNDMARSWAVSFVGFPRPAIRKTAAAPWSRDELLGLTQGRLYIRRAGGWEIFKREIHGFAIGGKDGKTIFSKTHGYRIDKSSDMGKTWQRRAEPRKDFSAKDIAYGHDKLFVIGWNGSLLVSEDEGETWEDISLALGRPYGACRIRVDPHDPSRIYLGVRPGGGHHVLNRRPPPRGGRIPVPLKLCRTVDGGDTWLDLPAGGARINYEAGYATVVAGSGVPGKILYAATFLGYPVALASVARSLDGGKTWEAFENQSAMGCIESLAVDPQDPILVYAGSARGRVYVSRDAGENWAPLGPNPDCGSVNHILVRPNGENAIYIGTRKGVYRLDLHLD